MRIFGPSWFVFENLLTNLHQSLSYQFAEQSVRRGKLEDPTSHRVGPAAPRPLGASNISTKSTRRSYTKQDDQIAFDWMYPWEQMKGAPTHGNKIYQDLAARVRIPHHDHLNEGHLVSHVLIANRSFHIIPGNHGEPGI